MPVCQIYRGPNTYACKGAIDVWKMRKIEVSRDENVWNFRLRDAYSHRHVLVVGVWVASHRAKVTCAVKNEGLKWLFWILDEDINA